MGTRATTYSNRDFMKKLRNNGYSVSRTRGSHMVWKNANGNTITTNRDINKMVARRLIKENNLK